MKASVWHHSKAQLRVPHAQLRQRVRARLAGVAAAQAHEGALVVPRLDSGGEGSKEVWVRVAQRLQWQLQQQYLEIVNSVVV